MWPHANDLPCHEILHTYYSPKMVMRNRDLRGTPQQGITTGFKKPSNLAKWLLTCKWAWVRTCN